MAISLSVNVCFNGCNSITIVDNTGVYNASTNTGGWNAPNLVPANVATATLTIDFPGTETTRVVDVLAKIPATVTGNFILDDYTITTASDGEFTVTYTIVDTGGITYTRIHTFFSTCAARCCVDKLWNKVAQGIYEEACDCDCGPVTDVNYIESAFLGETLLLASKSAFAMQSNTVRDKIIAKLTKLCDLQNCKCS